MEINKEYLQAIALIVVMMVDNSVYKDVTNCPISGKGLRSASNRLGCNEIYIYHCLLDDHEELIEKCLLFKWMRNGNCPIFITNANNGRGDLHQTPCLGKQRKERCPPAGLYRYKSSEVFKYPNCFRKQQKLIAVNMENSTIQSSNETVQSNISFGNNQIELVGLQYTQVVSSLSAVLISLMSVLALYLYYKRRYTKQKEADFENVRFAALQRFIEDQDDSDFKVSLGKEVIGSRHSKSCIKSAPVAELTVYNKGLRILMEKGLIIITGRIGSGKTSALEQILQLFTKNKYGWRIKTTSSVPDEHNKNWVIVMDDFFGKFVTNHFYRQKRLVEIRKLLSWGSVKKDKRKIILSMKESEFSENVLKEFSEIASCRLCLDDVDEGTESEIYKRLQENLKADESESIDEMKEHLFNKRSHSKAFSTLGMPLTCKLMSIACLTENPDYFMKNPFHCLVRSFENMYSQDQQLYCAMVFILFQGGNIYRLQNKEEEKSRSFLRQLTKRIASSMFPFEIDDQNKNANKRSFETEEERRFIRRKLSGHLSKATHFIKQTGEDRFRFHHDIISLGLLCHFYMQCPETTIEYLDFDILAELIRPKRYVFTENEFELSYLFDFDINNMSHEKCETNKNIFDKRTQQKSKKVQATTYEIWKFTIDEARFSNLIRRVKTEEKGIDFEIHPMFSNAAFKAQFNKTTA